MRTNPNDPYGKVLIVTGADGDQTMAAAQAVALHSDMLTGPQASIDSLRLPAKQAPDMAPRWAQTDHTIALWDYASAGQVQGDGTAPLNVYFRIPPDIFYSDNGPMRSCTWSIATIRFPSAPSPACRCASTARSWAPSR